MKSKAASGIMLTLLLIGMFTLAFNVQPTKAEPATWTVDDDGPADFSSIQEAINAASPGDTIYVYNGTYYEHVVVNKSVALVGENTHNTIVDGSGTNVISLMEESINLTGFTIQNGLCGIWIEPSSPGHNISHNIVINNFDGIFAEYVLGSTVSNNYVSSNNRHGIYLSGWSSGNMISDNNVSNNKYGIILTTNFPNTLRNNKMYNNTAYNFAVFPSLLSFPILGEHYDIDASNTVDGKPIYWWVGQQNKTIPSDAGCVGVINSKNITVKDLNLTNNSHGVFLSNTINSTITNVCSSNNEYGIQLWDTRNNVISHNNFINNKDTGIAIGTTGIDPTDSSNNTISGNNITSNNNIGISLEGSSNNTIIRNNVTKNDCGILLEQSLNNSISGNNIISNNYGIYFRYSSNNRFYHNSFIGNYYQVYISASGYANFWDDGYPSGGNYLSGYTGVDLFSGLHQNVTGSDGIGDTENVINAENIDHYPLMKPYGGPHDIGITSVTTSKTIIAPGHSLSVNITIINYGVDTETFNVTAYANTTTIDTLTNITLTNRNSTTVTITWNTTGVPYGTLVRISANVTQIPRETYLDDNTCVDGWVLVAIVGDVNLDGEVNVLDSLRLLIIRTLERTLEEEPSADVNCDGTINVLDTIRLLIIRILAA